MRDTRRRAATALAMLAVVATALTPARADATPRGIHVAAGADARTEASIVWFTHGAADPGTEAHVWEEDGPVQVVGGVANPAPGSGYPAGTVLVHEVVLEGLPPGSTIRYRVGSAAALSDERSFRTAPAEPQPFTFVAYGDQDVNENAQAVTDGALEHDPDLVVVAGDLSYAQPGTPTFPDWPKWDAWFDMIEPLASTRPFMPAVGNHECESVGCTASYRARFALPGEELFYSFDHANAHFLMFLSDRGTWQQERRLADALAFAEQDLADAAARRDAGELDWIIVVQHHPLYGSQTPDLLVDAVLERWYNPPLIALQERMLLQYGVDVLITGHNHHYQRSKPMRLGIPTTDETTTYVDPDGFIQVVTGGAGRGRSSIDTGRPLDDWQAAGARAYHYTTFRIDGRTLAFDAIAVDENAGVIDTFTITKT